MTAKNLSRRWRNERGTSIRLIHAEFRTEANDRFRFRYACQPKAKPLRDCRRRNPVTVIGSMKSQ